MRILIATHNEGKRKETQKLLFDLPVEILTLDDIPNKIDPPEENGLTYEENALIKAKTIADITGEITISDDSGLEVDAFPDLLGVKSARFADGTSRGRNTALLHMLEGKENRNATFVCCIVLYDPKRKQHHAFTGTSKGTIAKEITSGEGFDYDFVFVPDGYDKTYAQLGPAVKNGISHRALALQQLREYIVSLLK